MPIKRYEIKIMALNIGAWVLFIFSHPFFFQEFFLKDNLMNNKFTTNYAWQNGVKANYVKAGSSQHPKEAN